MKNNKIFVTIAFSLAVSTFYALEDKQVFELMFKNSSGDVKAKVDAQITMQTDTLYVGEYGAWHEEDGWGSYISNINVKNNRGKKLKIRKAGRLKWVVEDINANDKVLIEYIVSFPYAYLDYKWPNGPRSTASFYDGQGIVIQGESLFIYNSLEAKTIVGFKLPKDWEITTPWNELSEQLTYGGQSLEILSKNVIVVGVYDEITIEESGFTTKLVLLGYNNPNLEIIEPVFRKIINHHVNVFDYKGKGKYLMVWFPDGDWQTGEGYLGSYVVVKPDAPSKKDIPFWANTMSHETFHYWLGGKIAAQNWAPSQWFSEGFTELHANLSLIRQGIVSEQQFFNQMQKHLVLYQHFRYKWGTPYEFMSLIDAGFNKSQYNAAIYDGGTVTALCMDILIRKQTNNKKSIEDVLKILLYEKGSKDEKYTVKQVVEVFNRVTDKDWSDFYNKYVYGTEFLPVSDIMKNAGLNVIISQSGAHITKNESANALELDIMNSMFGFKIN